MILRTALALLVLLGGAVAQAATEPALADRVDALLARYAAFGFQGAVLVAARGEPEVARGYGVADSATGRRNDARTLFEIASITKQFTAAAILLLEQRGVLSTADSIAQHLPGVPDHSRTIAIHHLLTHTSGVPGANTRGRGEDLEAAVAAFLGDGPAREPGGAWEYWNGGYALLAGIVERASGQPFTEFCREHLFMPAGMADTGFTGSGWLDGGRAAIGASSSGAPRSALEHPYGSYGWQYRGMGGAVTTVLDLLRWHRALQGDAILGAAARAKLSAPAAQARGQQYACGWFVGESVAGTARLQHGGAVRGFLSDFRRFPQDDACVAVLANSDDRVLPYVAENLECLLFGKAPRHAPPPAVEPLAEAQLAAFAGSYAGEGDARIAVAVDGDGLLMAIEGQALLEAVGERGTSPCSLRALPVGDGAFVHWTWRGLRRFSFDGAGGGGASAVALRVAELELRRRDAEEPPRAPPR